MLLYKCKSKIRKHTHTNSNGGVRLKLFRKECKFLKQYKSRHQVGIKVKTNRKVISGPFSFDLY